MDTTTSVTANELLKNLDSTRSNDINYTILSGLLQIISSSLDQYGATTWNLFHVFIITVAILCFIRFVYPKNLYKIDWCGLVHAIITTIGSIVCMYLDTTYYKYSDATTTLSTTTMVSISEPARTIAYCAIPLTSIHRVLPAITLGYSILDFIHGLTLGIDFLFHGLITSISVYYMVVVTKTPGRMASMLFMEFSTIFLCFKDTTIVPESIKQINILCFVVAFFTCRIVIVPYIWYQLLVEIIQNYQTTQYQRCFPEHYMETIFVCGMLFHCLNSFWMYKIIQKVIRAIRKGSTNNNNNNKMVETKSTTTAATEITTTKKDVTAKKDD